MVWGKMERIPKLSGLGVDFDDIFAIRECNGDMRPFWGGKFQTILIITN
jgi:hypothetical protein